MNQPYILKFRFAFEHRIDGQSLVRLTYSGSRGVHLTGQLGGFNATQPQTLPDVSLYFPAGAPSRNPAFGRFKTRLSQFNSSYQGLMAEYQRRWSNGLRLQAGYTFSKSIDHTSSTTQRDFVTSDTMPTPLNFRANRGLSDFDVRHALTFNGSYQLPYGFDIHALLLARKGHPFSPFVGFDRAKITGGSSDLGQRPDLARPGAQIVLGDPARYFDATAFSLPRRGPWATWGEIRLPDPVSLRWTWQCRRSSGEQSGMCFACERRRSMLPTTRTSSSLRTSRYSAAPAHA
jgi:hypothetical protein